MSDQDISTFIAAAREEGFSHHERADRHRLDDIVLYRFWLPVRGTDLSTSLDLQVGLSAYHKQVLDRAREVSLSGQSVKVVAPEDLVLTKLSAFRPIDRADVIDVICLNNLDFDYIRHWAGRLNLDDRLADVVEAARMFTESSSDE